MFCYKCGKEKGEGDKFCQNCGVSFDGATSIGDGKNYNKIGGWLIVVAIGLIIQPFQLLYGVFDNVSNLKETGLETFNYLIPGLGYGLIFEVIIDIILVFVVLYLIFLFKDKKKIFPKYYIWYLGFSIIYLVLDYLVFASLSATDPEIQSILDTIIDEQSSTVLGGITGSVIWLLYILRSKRVKKTFIK